MSLSYLRDLARSFGIDVSLYKITSSSHARLKNYIRSQKIDLVLDVGANAGQTGQELRKNLGYAGVIHSFEPLSAAYAKLQAASSNDAKWHTHNLALGSTAGSVEINIAGNSESSSLLKMQDRHQSAAPNSAIMATEDVQVQTLDAVLPELRGTAQNIYMKCDTQGFELEVLKGAKSTLPGIKMIRLELSSEELYEGAPLIGDLVTFMYDNGFTMVDIKAGFSDPNTGQMLQADGLFLNMAP